MPKNFPISTLKIKNKTVAIPEEATITILKPLGNRKLTKKNNSKKVNNRLKVNMPSGDGEERSSNTPLIKATPKDFLNSSVIVLATRNINTKLAKPLADKKPKPDCKINKNKMAKKIIRFLIPLEVDALNN